MREGARVRAFCLYNSRGSAGWLDETEPAVRAEIDVRLRRHPGRAVRGGRGRGGRDRLPPRRADRDPVLLRRRRIVRATPTSGARSTCWRRPGAPGVGPVIETSTSEVYGTPETLPILETHPLNAQSPYAATKVAADQLALAFHRTYGLPVTVLRPFNTYGPRQSDRAVLPTMIRQLLAGQARDPARAARYAARPHVRARHRRRVRPDGDDPAPRRLHDPARHGPRRDPSASCSRSRAGSPGIRRPRSSPPDRVRPDASEVAGPAVRSVAARDGCSAGRPRPTSRPGSRRRSSGCAPTRAPRMLPLSSSRIALAEPTLGGNTARYLEECLTTNFVSSVGPFVPRFEAAFAAAVGSRYRGRLFLGDRGHPSRPPRPRHRPRRRGAGPDADLRRVREPGPVSRRDA